MIDHKLFHDENDFNPSHSDCGRIETDKTELHVISL